jgi:hypothetical protein
VADLHVAHRLADGVRRLPRLAHSGLVEDEDRRASATSTMIAMIRVNGIGREPRTGWRASKLSGESVGGV